MWRGLVVVVVMMLAGCASPCRRLEQCAAACRPLGGLQSMWLRPNEAPRCFCVAGRAVVQP